MHICFACVCSCAMKLDKHDPVQFWSPTTAYKIWQVAGLKTEILCSTIKGMAQDTLNKSFDLYRIVSWCISQVWGEASAQNLTCWETGNQGWQCSCQLARLLRLTVAHCGPTWKGAYLWADARMKISRCHLRSSIYGYWSEIKCLLQAFKFLSRMKSCSLRSSTSKTKHLRHTRGCKSFKQYCAKRSWVQEWSAQAWLKMVICRWLMVKVSLLLNRPGIWS